MFVQSVLFVCLGNICRSPLAEGAALHYAQEIGWQGHIDSAGTAAWHIGNPPDRRSIATAAARGIDISRQRARQVTKEDFVKFDLICAMDKENLVHLQQMAGGGHDARDSARLAMLLDYAKGYQGQPVPDPYYGGDDGFEHAWNLIAMAMPNILAALDR